MDVYYAEIKACTLLCVFIIARELLIQVNKILLSSTQLCLTFVNESNTWCGMIS